MSLKIGDTIRFLNDVGGGTVIEIIDKKHIMVENETGFNVPVSINEVILIEPIAESEPYSTKKEQQDVNITEQEINLDNIFYPEVIEIDENKDNINLHFAFVPQGRAGNSNLNIFLINDSNYNILYNIINKDTLGTTFTGGVGMLEANTKIQVDTFVLQAVNDMPEYIFHCSFYKKGDFKIKQPLVKNIKVNPIKFYKENAYLENDFFEENAIILDLNNDTKNYNNTSLTQKDIDNILKLKNSVDVKSKSKSRKEKEKETLETDLHINALLDDYRGLSNGEILEIQLERFNNVLNTALKKGPKRLVFIHGVGNGTLKTEVRKALDNKKVKLTYHDASFKEYGYGATMVKLKG